MNEPPACWCGHADLVAFCPGYLRCRACETLVSAEMPGADLAHVADEERDFYGRAYWFAYQEKHLGHPTIPARARLDLPERCLYWLRALLKYRRPPARVLEVGSGHGGFVAMLRWAGFDATGLEISRWVVDFARDTFGVPMLLGPVEDQAIAPGSLDVIVLMDVLEHLRDPAATMRHCLGLLAPDGILLIQTPCYPEASTYEEMAARSEQPLEILQPREHLYLFSQSAIREMFARLGAAHVAFEPALFAQYDMFLVVSRVPLPAAPAEAPPPLGSTPAARLIQALLDERIALEQLATRHADSERDRALRLAVIDNQGRRLGEVEAERNNLSAEVAALRQNRDVIEADRAARLAVIEAQGRRFGEVEAERNNLRAELAALCEHRDVIEADRAARLEVIQRQGRLLTELHAEIAAQQDQIHVVSAHLRILQRVVHGVQQSRAYRLLRRLGYWGWVDRAVGEGLLEAIRARRAGRVLRDGHICSFEEYRRSIDRFNSSQQNRDFLEGIRTYNHTTVDELNKICPLQGTAVLDVGASPHGYALERALERGARLYVGVGLDITRRDVVVGPDGSLGLLLNADAASLPVPPETFDLVLSLSTFEHVLDVDAVLSELARVLRPGGQALLTFEPIWSCSYGHHLHHFDECAKVVPPWSHLIHGPEEFRAAMEARWPRDASVSLGQAVDWVYSGREINRLTVRDFRERFDRSQLGVEWIVDLKEDNPDEVAARQAAAATGLSVDELTTKGLSVLLRKASRA